MKAPQKINLLEVNFNKYWEYPLPNTFNTYTSGCVRKNSADFIREYYPSGHKIYDKSIYPDLFYKIDEKSSLGKSVAEKNNGKSAFKQIPRKRISMPIQQDATRVILSHIFGNPISHKDISQEQNDESNKRMALFKNLWTYYNMDNYVRDFFGKSLICGDASLFLSINSRKEIVGKVLSYIDKDNIAVKQDRSGEVLAIYRKYTAKDENNEINSYVDVITTDYTATYTDSGELVEEKPQLFSFLPAVYHKRRDGAWWSFTQSNIEELEEEISVLTQDNKAKAKGKYFMSTTTPDRIKLQTFAESDVFVADKDSDMKFINPTTLSDAFKYTMEENKEIITKSLGYIFPKVQVSGDMPTGSMKAQFFPTERICMEFINEFAPIVDEVSWIFQQFVDILYPNIGIGEMKISSKIKLFSPTDNLSMLTAFADAYSKGSATPRSIVNNNTEYFDNYDLEYLMERDKVQYEVVEVDEEKKQDKIKGFHTNTEAQTEEEQ